MLKICKCLRCDHEWASRLATQPQQCPNCNARNWWEPRSALTVARIKIDGQPAMKYPVGDLVVGQSVLIPWQKTGDGLDRDYKAIANMNRAIYKYAKKHGKVLVREGTAAGLRVTRIK